MRRAALGVICLALAGCGRLAFERDERVRFLSPPERARVGTPVIVEWTAPAGFEGKYGIFVDRAPMRPGRDLDSLADTDPLCRRLPGCPDRRWLRDRDVHVRMWPRIVLPGLPLEGGRRAGGDRRHEVTVVLLDDDGVRYSEGQWTRSIYSRDLGRRR